VWPVIGWPIGFPVSHAAGRLHPAPDRLQVHQGNLGSLGSSHTTGFA